MAVKSINRYNELREDYPKNLLLCINEDWSQEAAENINEDIQRGLEYVISLLTEREQQILSLRYQEHMPLRQIADKFGLSTERIRRILAIIEMKFRDEENATFLSKGIAGTVKANYEKGYSVGYDEGYINGLKAGRDEVARPFEKEHILALPIEAVYLKPATFKHLKDAGYDTISDVYAITDKEVRKIKGLKPDRRREIIEGFKRYKIGKPDWKL